MRTRTRLCLVLIGLDCAWPLAARAQQGASYTPPPDWFIYLLIGAILLLIAAAIVAVANALSKAATSTTNPWRLSDALSEEGDVTSPTGVKQTIMVASSSRLIALFGMIVILALFLGVGTLVLWDLAKTGAVMNLDGILQYFLAGAGLFIPYSINQIRAGFESIGK